MPPAAVLPATMLPWSPGARVLPVTVLPWSPEARALSATMLARSPEARALHQYSPGWVFESGSAFRRRPRWGRHQVWRSS